MIFNLLNQDVNTTLQAFKNEDMRLRELTIFPMLVLYALLIEFGTEWENDLKRFSSLEEFMKHSEWAPFLINTELFLELLNTDLASTIPAKRAHPSERIFMSDSRLKILRRFRKTGFFKMLSPSDEHEGETQYIAKYFNFGPTDSTLSLWHEYFRTPDRHKYPHHEIHLLKRLENLDDKAQWL